MNISYVMTHRQTLPKMQVRRCLSLRLWFIVGLSFMLSLGAAFFLGHYLSQPSIPFTDQQELQQYLNKLNREQVRLKQLVHVTSINLAIEKDAQRRLLERLSAVETENADLKQELNFFVKLRHNVSGSKS